MRSHAHANRSTTLVSRREPWLNVSHVSRLIVVVLTHLITPLDHRAHGNRIMHECLLGADNVRHVEHEPKSYEYEQCHDYQRCE
jgi:hypothetical protein